jgi:hypothetical protein
MTIILTLPKESRCVIPDDVRVICAQLPKWCINIVNMKKYEDKMKKILVDCWGVKDKITYEVPLALYKCDVLQISSTATAIS